MGLRELIHTRGIGNPAVMTNAMEARRQHMDEEPANELISSQCHGLVASTSCLSVVFPLEGHTALIQGKQSAVGNRDRETAVHTTKETCPLSTQIGGST